MKAMLANLQPSLSTAAYRLAYAGLTLVAALSLVLLASGRADAAPVVDGSFDLSANPQRIAQGPDGNMWVTLSSGNEVARIGPEGVVTEFNIDLLAGATGIGAGPDGKVWVTLPTFVGRFDPADPVGTAARFAADIAGGQQIVTGPDGNLWTVSADKLLRITPAATPVVDAFPILTGGTGIVASGGMLWIADSNGGEVVSATTAGVPTRYATGGNPRDVAAGPNGQIGYTNPATPHSAGRLMPGGAPLPTPVKMGTDPYGMAFGADGAYWFAQPFGNNLGRLTTDGAYTEVGDFGPGAGPRYVAAGPANTLWVALQGLGGVDAKKVARVSGLEPPSATPPPSPANVAPVVSRLSVTPKRFRVAKGRTAITALKRGKGSAIPAGTKIRFTLGEAATVLLRVERRTAGRTRGGKCVKPTRALRSAKRCTRHVKIGTLTRRDLAAGKRSVKFSGRMGRRALKPGAYRVTAVATDSAGAKSTPRRRGFTVVAP
jgi:virginiamycin B lyase